MAQQIKSVHRTKDKTVIGFVDSYQPRDSTEVGNDKNKKECDLPRHADFELSLDRLTPHLLIACELASPTDHNGNFLQGVHFNDMFWEEYEEQDRFSGLEVTGIIIQGKNSNDGVQIVGTKTTSYGEVVKLKTPSIALLKTVDGYNYPLVDILAPQIETVLHEAEQYNLRKKHGAGVQTEMPLTPGKVAEETFGDALDHVIAAKKVPGPRPHAVN